MNPGIAGRLFAIVWCMLTDRPAREEFDAARERNRRLLAEYPELTAVMFPLAGAAAGAVLAVLAVLCGALLPRFGGAMVFSAAGFVIMESLNSGRGLAMTGNLVGRRIGGSGWLEAAVEASGDWRRPDCGCAAAAMALCFVIKAGGLAAIFISGRPGILIPVMAAAFALQGMLAAEPADAGDEPRPAPVREAVNYIVITALLILLAGIVSAPGVLVVTAAAAWCGYELFRRVGGSVCGGVPSRWITLAGSITETAGLLAAFILLIK